MQFAPLFPLVYRVLQPTFPHCLWGGNSNSKTIALTFDDGPHPQYTPQVLSVLKHYNITASFFWLGNCVNRFPHIAKAVSDQGYWIGLHGYEHDSFPLLSPSELKQSLEKTQFAIYNACGLSPAQVQDVRPPNGFFTPKTLQLFQQWNYRPVMWSVVPEDWLHPGVNVVVNRVMKQVKNGSLIVLHDGYFGGKDVAETINILIPQLLEKGYDFVNVDSLWQK
ncbi:polysaccharide deacetylase family protein [Cuspidothrix issatschenkoi LEGE 03284]|jgi:peptidoglycan/xylan/chitin deacetylase (PgdA/CDA1 family)|uniref:polysaccharide deacetylase family protein n=1 Tax=Cuspidothrix issatschenkoi TaxID=230752 RepID=UPI001881944E|nr:polysaccharide deacetylase family protein [Cuspidothrix issatschenkoi]MBE9232199.1 polysaccharide deacetylase family protein [Cuspidothrix issatschenkoi LEGE 03284]